MNEDQFQEREDGGLPYCVSDVRRQIYQAGKLGIPLDILAKQLGTTVARLEEIKSEIPYGDADFLWSNLQAENKEGGNK